MTNQLTSFLKRNKQWILISGVAGAIFFFASKGFLPQDTSTLQSSLGEGFIDSIGITGDIKTILFFIVIGIIIGLLIRGFKK